MLLGAEGRSPKSESGERRGDAVVVCSEDALPIRERKSLSLSLATKRALSLLFLWHTRTSQQAGRARAREKRGRRGAQAQVRRGTFELSPHFFFPLNGRREKKKKQVVSQEGQGGLRVGSFFFFFSLDCFFSLCLSLTLIRSSFRSPCAPPPPAPPLLRAVGERGERRRKALPLASAFQGAQSRGERERGRERRRGRARHRFFFSLFFFFFSAFRSSLLASLSSTPDAARRTKRTSALCPRRKKATAHRERT